MSKSGNIKYSINGVSFEKELFDSVRKDQLSATEVFSIRNMEQRRIAYEFMDKIKMRDLDGYTVLNKEADTYGYEMKIIKFILEGYEKPFIFLNCFCPSTGREYFIETQQTECNKAKAKSFGLEEIEFTEEF